mmetsp:Transcript_43896/g.129992  ORF Transcript_43896/g.129992 Transcript_43896/m.129992 type:complete len:410 (-) Transcript_43896:79-1308(-)
MAPDDEGQGADPEPQKTGAAADGCQTATWNDLPDITSCRASDVITAGSGAKAAKFLKGLNTEEFWGAVQDMPRLMPRSDSTPGELVRRTSGMHRRPASANSDPGARECPKRSDIRRRSAPNLGKDVATPLIIFDWDDTLFPTTFLTDVVLPGSPAASKNSFLPKDSPFAKGLDEHGRLVKDVLIKACSMASVCIVTLSARPWVENSAKWFMPNSGFNELLRKLEIPVFYAREHVSKREKLQAHAEEGVDLFTVAKVNAMRLCIQHSRKTVVSRSMKKNIISVGDAITEENALKEILWEDALGEDLCKTVRFVSDPSLEDLGTELLELRKWLEHLVVHSEDVHVILEGDQAVASMAETMSSALSHAFGGEGPTMAHAESLPDVHLSDGRLLDTAEGDALHARVRSKSLSL